MMNFVLKTRNCALEMINSAGPPPVGRWRSQDGICIKNDGLCIKNDGLCIKNVGFCIKNEGVCIFNEGVWCEPHRPDRGLSAHPEAARW